MDIIRPISKHIFEPLLAFYEGSNHLRYLRELERTQYLSAAEIRELQLRRLRVLLKHAYKNCPFYTSRFDEYGFKAEEIGSINDLRNLPVLTKKDIQEHKESMKARNFPDRELIPNKTGGSTGSPLHFYLNRERLFSRKASTIRHDRWTGWDIGVKMGVLWGHRIDTGGIGHWKHSIRNFILDRRIILDTGDITAEKLKNFTSALSYFKPPIYLAYANSMYLYARYLREKGIRDYHKPQSIITSAEVLTDEQRRVIEEVFECRVYNRYGCRETSMIASECPQHNGMHICAETLLVEFIKNNRACRDGELGKIVITDLLNLGMPLIRYQIEDMGSPIRGTCECGRGLPMMNVNAGRITDFLVAPDGRFISGPSLAVPIATIPGIAQAQLVQKERDLIILKIKKQDMDDRGLRRNIRATIREFFGSGMKFEVEFVEEIPKESSGKYRFSISEIDPLEYLS
jgi:phenylacetate-CoA ligase